MLFGRKRQIWLQRTTWVKTCILQSLQWRNDQCIHFATQWANFSNFGKQSINWCLQSRCADQSSCKYISTSVSQFETTSVYFFKRSSTLIQCVQLLCHISLHRLLILTRFTNSDYRPESFNSWSASATLGPNLVSHPFAEMDLLVKWLGPDFLKLVCTLCSANIQDKTLGLKTHLE